MTEVLNSCTIMMQIAPRKGKKKSSEKFLNLDLTRINTNSLNANCTKQKEKNVPASRAHSHRALRARSCALRIHLSLFLII